MLSSNPFQLYANKDFQKPLESIQLQWQSGGEVSEKTIIFLTRYKGIVNGLDVLLKWLNNIPVFDIKSVSYLTNLKNENEQAIFSESFLNFLQRFRFKGIMWAVENGVEVHSEQPVLQMQATPLHLTIIQLWLRYLVQPETYSQFVETMIQVRRFYNSEGKIIQDIIYSPDTTPIVNFEAASSEDLLKPLTIVIQKS